MYIAKSKLIPIHRNIAASFRMMRQSIGSGISRLTALSQRYHHFRQGLQEIREDSPGGYSTQSIVHSIKTLYIVTALQVASSELLDLWSGIHIYWHYPFSRWSSHTEIWSPSYQQRTGHYPSADHTHGVLHFPRRLFQETRQQKQS